MIEICEYCGGTGTVGIAVVFDPYPIYEPNPCGWCEGTGAPASRPSCPVPHTTTAARTPTDSCVIDHRCCALDDGHDGLCQWKCSFCGGSGICFACRGDGEDGSGLPGTCMECAGSGRCPYWCDEGWRTGVA